MFEEWELKPLFIAPFLALPPRTSKITSRAPVLGKVQYSSNGRSFCLANLKRWEKICKIRKTCRKSVVFRYGRLVVLTRNLLKKLFYVCKDVKDHGKKKDSHFFDPYIVNEKVIFRHEWLLTYDWLVFFCAEILPREKGPCISVAFWQMRCVSGFSKQPRRHLDFPFPVRKSDYLINPDFTKGRHFSTSLIKNQTFNNCV